MKIIYSISSPWIRPDMTRWIILSLSINTVLCIIAIISSSSSLFSKIFFKSNLNALVQPSKAPTTYFVTWTSFSRLECDLSILRRLLSPLCTNVFLLWTRHVTQIQIFWSILSSKIKSGLLAVVVFRKWNSKSHTSFALLFSSTVPLSHFCWHQILIH